MVMNTLEIDRISQGLIKDYDGTFAINDLPFTRKKKYKLILNTDTQNLPGSHWIALYVCQKKGYVFDPLGNSPPLQLQHWLNKQGIQWICNLRQLQPTLSVLCGNYCIYFLYFMSGTCDQHFQTTLNKIFPIGMQPNQCESLVRNFSKLFID